MAACRRSRPLAAPLLTESSPRCPAAARSAPGQVRDGRGGRRAVTDRAPPASCRPAPAPASRSPTWSRRSSPAARSSSPPPPRRCRTSWPARTCPFLAEHLERAVHLRGAEGPVELRVPASGPPRSAGRASQLALDGLADGSAPTSRGSLRSGRVEPRHDRRPATGPSLDFEPSPRAWAAVSVSADGVPRRGPVPEGRGVLRRAGPGQAAAEADVVVVNTHLYGLHLARAAGSCPSTTWW